MIHNARYVSTLLAAVLLVSCARITEETNGDDLVPADLASPVDGAALKDLAAIDLTSHVDLAPATLDEAEPFDASAAIDAAVPDLEPAIVDSATRSDLAHPIDLSSADLTAHVDLATPIDLVTPPDLAAPNDLATPADLALHSDLSHCGIVKINEVQTEGNGGSEDEYIELYNPCPNDLDLANYVLDYRAINGVVDVTFVVFPNITIHSLGYLVVANVSYLGKSDVTYNVSSLSYKGGGLGLYDPKGNMVDAMGYGQGATNAYVKVAPAPAPPTAMSTARVPDGTDTDNSSVDFTVRNSTPGAANH